VNIYIFKFGLEAQIVLPTFPDVNFLFSPYLSSNKRERERERRERLERETERGGREREEGETERGETVRERGREKGERERERRDRERGGSFMEDTSLDESWRDGLPFLCVPWAIEASSACLFFSCQKVFPLVLQRMTSYFVWSHLPISVG